MDDIKIQAVIRGTDRILALIENDVTLYTGGIKQQIRDQGSFIRDEISVRVARCEVTLTRVIALVAYDAEYHIASAYFHASPGLIVLIKAIFKVVTVILDIIGIINTVLQVITGQNLVYWLNQIIPGFQDMWNDLMDQISKFSKDLGWGVDGVLHLMNITNIGSGLVGSITGKDYGWVQTDMYKKAQKTLASFSAGLENWQSNPGKMISLIFASNQESDHFLANTFMGRLTDKLDGTFDKVELFASGLGQMTSELAAIQNDMPALVAKNIPQALWAGVTKVDAAINDRILPQLTMISDSLDELNFVMEAQRKKAAELADKIAHPGDLLMEISKLPDYARDDQLSKIDSIVSYNMSQDNEIGAAERNAKLSEFSKITQALSEAPEPIPFMELELPGKSPGITAEPRETWLVGDF